MLEDFALQYFYSEHNAWVFVAVFIAGAIIAGVTWGGTLTLQRVPCFAWVGIIVLMGRAGYMVWLNFASAIAGGYLWVLVAVDAIRVFAVGFAVCVVAMARSRDAYGHARMAVLAFIPIAQFWLLLKRSRDGLNLSGFPTDAQFSGVLGLVTGIVVLMGARGLDHWVSTEVEKKMATWSQTDAGIVTNNRVIILQQGLEKFVQMISDESEVPIEVDDITTIVEIKAEGTTIRYIYTVDTRETVRAEAFLPEWEGYWCAHAPLLPVIETGGAISASYYNLDKVLIGEASADAASCGFD